MNSPKALESIELISNEMKGKVVVGAGTVLDAESARLAILSGATFILSPTVDKDTIRMSKKIWCRKYTRCFNTNRNFRSL